jgi:hypothetical protein
MTEKIRQNSHKSDNAQPSGSYSGGSFNQALRWNEFELPKLSLGELQALCKLLGCPSYGAKETLVVRLLAQRVLKACAFY